MKNLISKFALTFVALLSLAAPEAIAAPGVSLWHGLKNCCSDIRVATKSAIAPKVENDVTPLVPVKGFRNRARRFRLELLRQQILRDFSRVDRAKIIAAGLADEYTPLNLEIPKVYFMCGDTWKGSGSCAKTISGYDSFSDFVKSGGAVARLRFFSWLNSVLLIDPYEPEPSKLVPLHSIIGVRGSALHEFGHCCFSRDVLNAKNIKPLLARSSRLIQCELDADWFIFSADIDLAIKVIKAFQILAMAEEKYPDCVVSGPEYPTWTKRLEHAKKTCDEHWPGWREYEAKRADYKFDINTCL